MSLYLNRQNVLPILLIMLLVAGCSESPTRSIVHTPSAQETSTRVPTEAAGQVVSGTPEYLGPTPTKPDALKPRNAPAGSGLIKGLHVEGNKLLDHEDRPVRLLGVNRSGTEYACIQGWGFSDGPADHSSVGAIASWRVNAVRVPLNETCWLGINGAPPKYSGAKYRKAIADYVRLLNRHGLVAILELHWSATGTSKAVEQQPMPNKEHTLDFWRQVASTYKNNGSVVFDLFNEPYPANNADTDEAWRCWRDGGSACQGVWYTAVGMQDLVDAIRDTGARNVIMLSGIQYANELSRWLEYKPSDPLNNLAASWHVYEFNGCNSQECWDTYVAPIAQRVPLIAAEIGEREEEPCTADFVQSVMKWLDRSGASYLAWTWNTWGKCTDLIIDYKGSPTPVYGAAIKRHLALLDSPRGKSLP